MSSRNHHPGIDAQHGSCHWSSGEVAAVSGDREGDDGDVIWPEEAQLGWRGVTGFVCADRDIWSISSFNSCAIATPFSFVDTGLESADLRAKAFGKSVGIPELLGEREEMGILHRAVRTIGLASLLRRPDQRLRKAWT